MKLKINEAYVDEDYIEVSFWSYFKFHILGVVTLNGLMLIGLTLIGLMLGW